MKRKLLSIFSALMLALPGLASADVDALMQGCNDCHGDNGVSQWSDVPSIAGLPEFVHSDQLYTWQDSGRPCVKSEFRQGDTSRPAASMCDAVADLSEDDIDGIAAAYAALPWTPAAQEFDADLAAAGKALHDQNCERCHSDGGMNPDDEASMLGGQQMGYLRNAFGQFNDGSREQPSKMKEKLDALSADDLEALVHFYGSLQ